MRLLLILWALPLIFFWGWYGLSYYDINFGTAFLSRHTHNVIFALYGQILGMNPADVPLALAKIFAIDSLLIFAIAAFRWRKKWYPQTKQWFVSKSWVSQYLQPQPAISQDSLIGPVRPAE